MDIRYFESKKEALSKLGEKEFKTEHAFKAADNVSKHRHPVANEWVLADNGEFVVVCGSEARHVETRGKAVLIHFPAMVSHGLLAFTDITYTVYRDRKDKTEYLDRRGNIIETEED